LTVSGYSASVPTPTVAKTPKFSATSTPTPTATPTPTDSKAAAVAPTPIETVSKSKIASGEPVAFYNLDRTVTFPDGKTKAISRETKGVVLDTKNPFFIEVQFGTDPPILLDPKVLYKAEP
jgi:hypothetical protein